MTTPTTPELKLDIYHVWMAEDATQPEDATYHRVVVTMEDQLRAERELARLGVSFKKYPLRAQSMMLWASMQRTGSYTGEVADFTARVVQYVPDERVEAEAQTPDDETVIPPTGASTS